MKQILHQLSVAAILSLPVTAATAAQPAMKERNAAKPEVNIPLKPAQKRAAKPTKRSHFRLQQNSPISVATSSPVRIAYPKKFSAPSAAAQNMPKIIGYVSYSDNGFDGKVCEIPTADGQSFNVLVESVNADDGGTGIDNTYYAAYHTSSYGEYQIYINSYDLTTGAKKGQTLYGKPSCEATDVAYNPADGKVYGCFCDPDSEGDYFFGTIDYSTAQTTRIAALPRELAAVAVSPAGKIYVIDKQVEDYSTTGADLYEISATTGEMTLIGKTGLKPEYRTSACIDPQSGRMFWTVAPDDGEGYLYEVDLATGRPTLLYQFPGCETINGLYIASTGVTADSPEAVGDFRADFPGGNVDGSVAFTLPTYGINGTPLTGSLSWTLCANSKEIKTGTGTPGEKVTVPVSLAEEGLYKFTVAVTAGDAKSPEAELSLFIGHDTPVAPEVSATLADGVITVSWKPVTTAVNGGYLDPEKMFYTVTRQPDGKVIAESTKATSVTDRIGSTNEMAAYSYTVKAACAGLESEAGKSPKVITGNIVPPFTDDFNDISKFEFYTVINANNDENQWGPYIGNLNMTYNPDMAMDDWLITPPMMLEKGKAYKFTVDVLTGNATTKERFEIRWGRGNTVADMTETLGGVHEVAHTDYVAYGDYIVPEETGLHYVGIHACSDADTYTINLDNLTISEGLATDVPAVPEEFTVTGHTNGELKADVSVKAPSTALGGAALTELTSVTIKRDGTTVHTFQSPAPGAVLTFTDDVDECGDYTYTACAANASGEGATVTAQVHVGVLEPADPLNVDIRETETPGEVTISWEAPATDVKGNQLDPQYITYRIYKAGSTQYDLVKSGITETSCTLQALDNPEKQDFVLYLVVAETLGGVSDGIPTKMIPVGKPYAAPYRESFAKGEPWSILGTNSAGGAKWQLFSDDSGVAACDGDNGFIGSVANYLDEYGSLMSGKVDLSGTENPALTFATYSITSAEGEPDTNEIEVAVVCDGEEKTLRTFRISDYSETDEWITLLVPMTEYKGKTVQLKFTAVHKLLPYVMIDRIRLENLYDHNLSIAGISAPEMVKGGTDFSVTAKIENNGVIAAPAFTARLWAGDKIADTKQVETLESFKSTSVSFTAKIPVTVTEPQNYRIEVVYEADEAEADNMSETVTVTPVAPTLPAVKNLTAEGDGNAINLAWETPDPEDYIPDVYVEDFENCDSWATMYSGNTNGWTLVDRDGACIGGFSDDTSMPGIDNLSKQSFFVFDQNTAGFNDYYFNAHSGTKFLAQMFSYKQGTGGYEQSASDDWAISPELFGGEQTVSLWARAYDPEYPETFEILYSTGSTDPEDFILVKKFDVATDVWTCYNAKLPEGARRMAIRCTSDFRFMLFADDVTFIPAPAENEIVLSGYNIYRDGELIGTVDNNVNNFSDTGAEAGKEYSYAVTALYGNRESRLSDSVRASQSGMAEITAGTITITAQRGTVTVTGAAGETVAVIAPDGLTVVSTPCAEDVENYQLAAGVYIVKAADVVKKVLVK